MTPRLNPYNIAPSVMQPMIDLEATVKASGLEADLIELVKTRASQINGCAYCIYMHTRDALAAGEDSARLLLLDAWRESPLYSDRERAALDWTEVLTLVAETHAPDAAYVELTRQYSNEEQVKLTLLIATINAWNRIAIGFRSVHPVDREARNG